MDNNTEKDTDVILEVKDLKTYFKTGPHKVVKAVEGVNFSLRKGKVLGIIGESGSGKSVTARSILRIVESPGYIAGGEIRFKGGQLPGCPCKTGGTSFYTGRGREDSCPHGSCPASA